MKNNEYVEQRPDYISVILVNSSVNSQMYFLHPLKAQGSKSLHSSIWIWTCKFDLCMALKIFLVIPTVNFQATLKN